MNFTSSTCFLERRSSLVMNRSTRAANSPPSKRYTNRFVSQKTRVTRTPHGVGGHRRQGPPLSTDRGAGPPTRAGDLWERRAPSDVRTNPVKDGTLRESQRVPAQFFHLRAWDGMDRPDETVAAEMALFRTACGNDPCPAG